VTSYSTVEETVAKTYEHIMFSGLDPEYDQFLQVSSKFNLTLKFHCWDPEVLDMSFTTDADGNPSNRML
jgi:hypothetical protein